MSFARRFSRMAPEQGHGMGFGLGVYSHFGLEVDAHAHDILEALKSAAVAAAVVLRPP